MSLHLHYPYRHRGNLAAAQQQRSALRDSINHYIPGVRLTGISVPHSPNICYRSLEAEHFLLFSRAGSRLQWNLTSGDNRERTFKGWSIYNTGHCGDWFCDSLSCRVNSSLFYLYTHHPWIPLKALDGQRRGPLSQTSIQALWQRATTEQDTHSPSASSMI